MGTVHAKVASSQQGENHVETPGRNIPTRETSVKENYPCNGAHGQAGEYKQLNVDGVKHRNKICVDGLNRTKDDIIIDAVKELFKAKDLDEVFNGAIRIRGKLDSLGCFRNIGIHINTSSGPDATPDGLVVTFHVKELKRITGGVSTTIGNNNEGSLLFAMSMPNLFGRGEKVKAEYNYGSKKTVAFNMSLTKPLQGQRNPVHSCTLFQTGSEWPWSGYKQIERGLLLDLSFNSLPLVINNSSLHIFRHNLQWEGLWRDLSCLSRTSAFQVREQTGPTLKSSLRHVLTVDQRDKPIFPTCGYLFKLTQEVAGLGGNIGFLKNELKLQHNITVFPDVVLQTSLYGGILMPISKNLNVNICDHFSLEVLCQ
ncbi:hypothetical protein L9F63_018738 [Diploptera punctata]|uniref:Bacterial surface antigen (D15) domain-containing protein n=1 Tax=Diploptera punctata TaxID=6984 RepID=A0AAD7ZVZ6_DIPPU|nr:hypothetical protein L9F63_018738 [Diploptera punctata]